MILTSLGNVSETTRILRGQWHQPLAWLVIPAMILLLAACFSQETVKDHKVTPLPTSSQATGAAEHEQEKVQEPMAITVVQATVAAPAKPSGGAGLEISVDGDALKFNTGTLTAQAGAEVVLTFSNVSTINQHNWVLVRAEDKAGVVTDGTAAGPANDWLKPDDPRVIAQTKLLNAGDTGEVRFTAPEPGATYQFVCTFPGHDASGMFGKFQVSQESTAVPAAAAFALDIAVDGDALKFNTGTLTVQSAAEVVLTFSNVSTINQHNWVLVRAEDKAGVVADGTAAGPANDWLKPGDPRVIAHTKLLSAGETGEVRFTAPEPGATYQFVCTFPGHDASGMFGGLQVTS